MPLDSQIRSFLASLEPEPYFDADEIAHEAAECLEAYRRAPWRQMDDWARRAQLRRAIELLQRIECLETEHPPV